MREAVVSIKHYKAASLRGPRNQRIRRGIRKMGKSMCIMQSAKET